MINDKEQELNIRVGELIRRVRTIGGMSQKDLARKIGVTHQQIQKYETAGNSISLYKLQKICDVLEIPISDFINGILPNEYSALKHKNFIKSMSDMEILSLTKKSINELIFRRY